MLDHEARVVPVPVSPDPRRFNHEELACLFRAAVQEAVAAHLAAGDPVFSCGLGEEIGRLFMHTPAGDRFEVRRGSDGSYERLHEVA